jgi:hypothetical protein
MVKNKEKSVSESADITTLCHLIMSCDKFKADTSKLAPILGISQSKNVQVSPHRLINESTR